MPNYNLVLTNRFNNNYTYKAQRINGEIKIMRNKNYKLIPFQFTITCETMLEIIEDATAHEFEIIVSKGLLYYRELTE